MATADVEPPLSVCAHCKSIFRSGFSRCPADGTELETLVVDPFEGQIFAGRYAIEGFVGQGAMGRVYRARHTRMSKKFAVKIMFGDLASDATMRARFQSEAEAASRLDHPNVVSVVDFGDTVGGLVYMVMDFVEGKSLARLLEEANGPMPEARVRGLLRQIGLGLQHAHDRGLVHRDLKTDNVVVVESDGEEIARIIDFGIAMFADAAPGPAKLTAVGVVIGTPAYMSPEQACGEKLDHRSDLFSLGIMAYEMLAGRKPFDGHPFEMARQNIASTPPPIHQRSPLAIVEPRLEAIVFRLLAKDREERFANAQALVDAIDGVSFGTAEVETTLKLAVPPSRSSPSLRAARTTEVDLSAERPLAGGTVSRAGTWAVLVLVVVVGVGAMAAMRLRGPATGPVVAPIAQVAPAPDPSPMTGTVTASIARAPVPMLPLVTPAPVEELVVEDDPDEPAAGGGDRAARPRPSRRPYVDRRPRASGSASEDEGGAVNAQTLTTKYRQLTRQMDLLAKQRGQRFADGYEEKMRRVRALYVDALRDPSKQRQAADEVDRLKTEISRL